MIFKIHYIHWVHCFNNCWLEKEENNGKHKIYSFLYLLELLYSYKNVTSLFLIISLSIENHPAFIYIMSQAENLGFWLDFYQNEHLYKRKCTYLQFTWNILQFYLLLYLFEFFFYSNQFNAFLVYFSFSLEIFSINHRVC